SISIHHTTHTFRKFLHKAPVCFTKPENVLISALSFGLLVSVPQCTSIRDGL
ncbi:hypothetical protein L9F63_023703, partial [Diploptera punctata]